MNEAELRKEILGKVREYFRNFKAAGEFKPGDRIPYAARVFDEKELMNLVDSSLDFWLTEGRFADEFKAGLALTFGAKFCSLTTSGSSANLLALTALTSNLLGEKKLAKGDVVITAAAGFPTTVNPIFQNGLVPKFVDVELGTYNPTPEMIEEAISQNTKAIMIAHALGNPFEAKKIAEIASERGLYLIEDCCDALGSTLNRKHVGTFGDLATASFYPAHHITTGEGGAVLTSNPVLKRAVESYRDWGRDCWCATGKDNTCKKRFKQKLGNLPYGYDHKYVYSHIGYNLKMTDMQAAVGLAQLEKLPDFIKKRRENFDYLLSRMKKHSDVFILPKKAGGAEPSPFGFPLTVKEDAGFSRAEIISCLETKGIATRMLFGGNLTRQPAYLDQKFEVSGSLSNSDMVMNSTFWVGVYPGLTKEMLKFMADRIDGFLETH